MNMTVNKHKTFVTRSLVGLLIVTGWGCGSNYNTNPLKDYPELENSEAPGLKKTLEQTPISSNFVVIEDNSDIITVKEGQKAKFYLQLRTRVPMGYSLEFLPEDNPDTEWVEESLEVVAIDASPDNKRRKWKVEFNAPYGVVGQNAISPLPLNFRLRPIAQETPEESWATVKDLRLVATMNNVVAVVDQSIQPEVLGTKGNSSNISKGSKAIFSIMVKDPSGYPGSLPPKVTFFPTHSDKPYSESIVEASEAARKDNEDGAIWTLNYELDLNHSGLLGSLFDLPTNSDGEKSNQILEIPFAVSLQRKNTVLNNFYDRIEFQISSEKEGGSR